MKARAGSGKPAHLRLTRDWHELLAGDLRPGAPLVVHYDPARVVPAADGYFFGDPQRPVTAWVDYGTGQAPQPVMLRSHAGLLQMPDVDITGHGSMLSARLDVPADATAVTLSFSYLARSGTVCVDDDHGARFRFGFTGQEITLRAAEVVEQPGRAVALFGVEVAAHPDVTAVEVSFRVIGSHAVDPGRAELARAGGVETGGWVPWKAAGIEVPAGAKLRFKLDYWRGDLRTTDDNAGQYYLAPEPPAESVPPPPEALGRESMRW